MLTIVFPGTSRAASESAKPRLNYILITVDGLRADHLAFYGYDRSTMPNIERRAKNAVIFEQAEAQASWTLPSFASLFTSRYPTEHRTNHINERLGTDEVLLADILRQSGYRTAGFVGGPFLEPPYGFAKGFDIYRSGGSRNFKQTVPQAVDWLREKRKEPFFLFVHGNDVHPPFNLPDAGQTIPHAFDQDYTGLVDTMLVDYFFVKVFNRYAFSEGELRPDADYAAKIEQIRNNPRDIAHIVSHYDTQIVGVDQSVEEIFRTVEESGQMDRTVIILTADHGLELGEKGLLGTGHHTTIWETITHVPLLIWHPELKPQRIKSLVELIDIAPTILEFAGLPSAPSFKGKTLTAPIRGRGTKKRYAFSASTIVSPEDHISLFAIRDDRWKLIYRADEGIGSLYDLLRDPREEMDIKTQNPQEAMALTNRLHEHIRR